MKGLLTKDMKLLLGQKSYYIILVVLATAMGYLGGNITPIFTFICTVLPMFTLSSISYDQFDNGNTFLFSLPVTRQGYVLEKYAFSFILEGCALLLSTVLSIIVAAALDGGATDTAWALSDLVFILPVIGALVLVVMSIMIPVHLKYGAERGRVALIIVVGGMVAFSFLVSELIKMCGGSPLGLAALVEKLERMGIGVLIAAILAAATAVCAVSVGISLRIIRKKEY